MKNIILIVLFTFSSTFVFAQNEKSFVVKQVLKQLKISEKEINTEFVAEKIIPNDDENSIVIIPKYSEIGKENFDADYFEMDAYIVICNNKTGKILAKFVEPNYWVSDAVMLRSITIDTGLYILNDKTRAFGIRSSYSGSSRPNPYSATDLSLFILKNNKLEIILNNYSLDRSTGEWDTNCAGEFEDSSSVITFDKQKSKNFKNIILKIKTINTTNVTQNGDCNEQEKTYNSTKTLKFNGKEYK